MCDEKKQRVRGRRSKVLAGETKGGVIVCRLPTDTHAMFAALCKEAKESMNTRLIALIEKDIENATSDR